MAFMQHSKGASTWGPKKKYTLPSKNTSPLLISTKPPSSSNCPNVCVVVVVVLGGKWGVKVLPPAAMTVKKSNGILLTTA